MTRRQGKNCLHEAVIPKGQADRVVRKLLLRIQQVQPAGRTLRKVAQEHSVMGLQDYISVYLPRAPLLRLGTGRPRRRFKQHPVAGAEGTHISSADVIGRLRLDGWPRVQ